MKRAVLTSGTALLAAVLSWGADGVWTGGTGNWTDTAQWSGAVMPGSGECAAFVGPGGTVTVPPGALFTLAALLFNTNGANVAWTLAGETNTLVAPAEIRVAANTATLATVLAGNAGLSKTGNGVLELTASNNLFSGATAVSGGLLRVCSDGSLGTVPESVKPDAITLDGGGLTDVLEPLTLHANRGVTLGPGGGWFLARYYVPVDILGPITGPGSVAIARQSNAVIFSNPANDYAGDTVLGTDDVGYWSDVNAMGLLKLGADEVIPHGTGKGALVFNGAKRGVLDLNGKTETVNTLIANGDLCLSNSAVQAGVLRAGLEGAGIAAFGDIQAGAVLEKIGAGVMHFSDNGLSRGAVQVSEGDFAFSAASALGEMTVRLNGGTLKMTETQPGLVESRATGASGSINLSLPMTERGVRPGTVKGFAGITPFLFGDNTQYRYTGQWQVTQAGTYSFAKSFDDGAYLALDGRVLLNNSTHNGLSVTQNVAVAAGWHTLEVRFSNGTGSVGPYGGAAPAGIVFDSDNKDLSNSVHLAAARRFEDPGDGSVLRTMPLGSLTNVIRAPLELAQDSTFDRSATAAPLVWAADVRCAAGTAGTPVLTVTGGAEPFRVGGPERPVVFGVDVADAGGVVFSDKIWLLTVPALSAWSIEPGSDVAAGTPGILGTGPQTLTDYSLRIPRPDALGVGGETVTVNGSGLAVWFDSTRETAGRLYDDPAHAWTAEHDVALTGAGAVAGFDGAGTVNYAGTISGSGTLVKNGAGDAVLDAPNSFSGAVQINAGRLVVSDDAQLGDPANAVAFAGGLLGIEAGSTLSLPRAFTAASGGVDVPDAAALTLTGALSGTFAKQGGGTLMIGGSAANDALDLAVDAGVAELGKSDAPAVRHIVRVASNAAVRLTGGGGNQIAGHVTLTGGTLDLNGRPEGIGALDSTWLSSTVVNGGAAAAALSVGEADASSVFFGRLADGAAPLALAKTGGGILTLAGGGTPSSYSGSTTVGAGTLAWGTGVRYVRFRVDRTRTAGQMPAVSEFHLLLDDEWVPYPAGAVIYATSSNGPTGGPDRLIDTNTVTKWLAASANNQYFRVDLLRPTAVNGYRWYTANDVPERDPVSWTVEVSADNVMWYTVDQQENVPVLTTRTMLAGAWPFRTPFAGNQTASSLSAVSVSAGATLQLNSPYEAIPSLSGSGVLAFSSGQALTVADLSGFTGRVAGAGRLMVQGAGGATPSLAGMPSAVTVVNAGSAPLDVAVGGASDEAFSAAVRDGVSPAGLVKQGASSTVTLFGPSLDYTGDTRVEAGTLAIAPGTPAYRYVRFSTFAVRDPTAPNTQNRISLGEFQLTLGGVAVTLPAGTQASALGSLSDYGPEKAIDGAWDVAVTRWIGTSITNWLKIDMLASVAFDGYQFYTASDAAYDWGRDPITWRFEGSHDGTAWTLLDAREHEIYPNQRSFKVGPFELGRPAPVPPSFWAAANAFSERVEAVTARYVRFNPTRIRLGNYEYPNTGFQFAELQLLLDDAVVPYPAGTAASAPGGGYNRPEENNVLTPDKVVDNILPSEEANNRWYSQSLVNPLTVDMGSPVTFNGYRWYTGLNGTSRDPLSWTLEVSCDGTNWFLADTQTNWWGTLTRKALAGEWKLRLPARAGMLSCAIPDASRTRVESGAVLRLAGAAETVGPLSGAGTVELADASWLGVHAFEPATFTGSFIGAGTLAVQGGAQAFAGASLSGVTNLLLSSAGAVTGDASMAGDLTVRFAGGAYGATLAVGGALHVDGNVAYVLPQDVALPYRRTLFSFASVDAATRDALAAGAAALAVPEGFKASVHVTDTQATLTVASPSTVLTLQ